MTKTTKSITVDAEIWDNLAEKNENMSGLINDFLKNMAEIGEKKLEIDKKMVKIQKKNIILELSELKSRLKQIEDFENQIRIDEEKAEIERLEKEKEIESKRVYCMKCKQILPTPSGRIKYKDGYIHLDCFRNLPKEEQKEVLKDE